MGWEIDIVWLTVLMFGSLLIITQKMVNLKLLMNVLSPSQVKM